MNKELIEKATAWVNDKDFDCIVSANHQVEFTQALADFAEKCVKDDRKWIADALESAYGGGTKNVIQSDILNIIKVLRWSAEQD